MRVPNAKEKDFVLQLYYNRDVKGMPPPNEEDCPRNFREIEAILQDDGFIESYRGYLVINVKGRAFHDKGGYTALRNREWLKYGLSYASGVISVVVAWLLTKCTN